MALATIVLTAAGTNSAFVLASDAAPRASADISIAIATTDSGFLVRGKVDSSKAVCEPRRSVALVGRLQGSDGILRPKTESSLSSRSRISRGASSFSSPAMSLASFLSEPSCKEQGLPTSEVRISRSRRWNCRSARFRADDSHSGRLCRFVLGAKSGSLLTQTPCVSLKSDRWQDLNLRPQGYGFRRFGSRWFGQNRTFCPNPPKITPNLRDSSRVRTTGIPLSEPDPGCSSRRL